MGWVGSGWGDFLTQPTMLGLKKFNPIQPITEVQPKSILISSLIKNAILTHQNAILAHHFTISHLSDVLFFNSIS